jgi:uncharacterized protein YraI
LFWSPGIPGKELPMNARSFISAAAFCAALALPSMADAQTIAYAVRDGYTNLRAGPGTNYRVVALVYPGTQLQVLGCIPSRRWCDVIAHDIRGWMAASRMEFAYVGAPIYEPDYYPYQDDVIIQFEFGDDDHYRRRPRGRRHDGEGMPLPDAPPIPINPPPAGPCTDELSCPTQIQ